MVARSSPSVSSPCDSHVRPRTHAARRVAGLDARRVRFSCPFARRGGNERAGGSQPADDQPVHRRIDRARGLDALHLHDHGRSGRRRALRLSEQHAGEGDQLERREVRTRRGGVFVETPDNGPVLNFTNTSRFRATRLGVDSRANDFTVTMVFKGVVVHDQVVVDLERFSAECA